MAELFFCTQSLLTKKKPAVWGSRQAKKEEFANQNLVARIPILKLVV